MPVVKLPPLDAALELEDGSSIRLSPGEDGVLITITTVHRGRARVTTLAPSPNKARLLADYLKITACRVESAQRRAERSAQAEAERRREAIVRAFIDHSADCGRCELTIGAARLQALAAARNAGLDHVAANGALLVARCARGHQLLTDYRDTT